MGLTDGFLQQLGQGDSVKDFAHASKLYVGDNFNLAPRQGFLYHVFLDLTPSFASKVGSDPRIAAGMLVKSVDLPKFSVDNKVLNSYNRPNVVQTKVKYDPITIQFHDDHADVVRSIWFQYYRHFYRDADLGYSDGGGMINPGYFMDTKYGLRQNNQWGYTPMNGETRLINAIRIYSMSQKRFAEYTLINPVITGFKHGQHQAGNSEGMQHEMTVAYESVLYGAGWVSNKTVQGFAGAVYDHSPSPLTPAGGGTQSILGPGGLMDTGGDVVNDVGGGNFASAAFKAYRGYNTLKKTDLKAAAKAELTQLGKDILRGGNPMNKFFIPIGAAIYEYNQSKGNKNNGSITSNGEDINLKASPYYGGTTLDAQGYPVDPNTLGQPYQGAGAENKVATVDPDTNEVTSVDDMPDQTAEEQQQSDMDTNNTNEEADSNETPDDNTSADATQNEMDHYNDDATYPDTSTDTNETTTEPTAEPSSYTIQPGDTLSKLAAQYGTTVDELMSLNPSIKNPNKIYAGTTLNIPYGH